MIIGMEYTTGMDESDLRPIVDVFETAFLDDGEPEGRPTNVIDGLYAIADAINNLTRAIEEKN
jgi:hypothetical protein